MRLRAQVPGCSRKQNGQVPKMRILISGSTKSLRAHVHEYRDYLGTLHTPFAGNSIPNLGLPWACDNGAFSGFNEVKFLKMMDRIEGIPGILWIAAPDVVADAKATEELYQHWHPQISARGFPVAFVGQDGCIELPNHMDCFFIGGSTEWKLGPEAADLARAAKSRGALVHMGRVNSQRRIRYAASIGCDSIDGTSVSMFGDTKMPDYLAWVRGVTRERPLF